MILSCSTHDHTQQHEIIGDISYAKGFQFETGEDAEYLVINTPWPGATDSLRYKLTERPKRFVCTSTSHLAYFELLDEVEAVVGFPNTSYISSKRFQDRIKKGAITDLGTDGTINLELLLSVRPDAVIAFDMGGESTGLDKVEEAGIPVYYNSDFLEETPLGRAEWIKFFGMLLNKRKKADSIFTQISTQYNHLVSKTAAVDYRPTILSGVLYGDAWFLPGGNNWASTFYKDAGGHYMWENDTTSGWLNLSFESVYEKANGVDYWIGTSTVNSKEELLSLDERYGSFAPFVSNTIYSYNKSIGSAGGYDFFESGYSRPDLVLSDLIKILHPALLPSYETVYFQRLP